MAMALSPEQCARQAVYRGFVDEHIVPFADGWDQAECMPREAIQRVAGEGYLGAILPTSVGGLGLDTTSLGILHEEVGRGCSSMRSLLTNPNLSPAVRLVRGAFLRNQRSDPVWLGLQTQYFSIRWWWLKICKRSFWRYRLRCQSWPNGRCGCLVWLRLWPGLSLGK